MPTAAYTVFAVNPTRPTAWPCYAGWAGSTRLLAARASRVLTLSVSRKISNKKKTSAVRVYGHRHRWQIYFRRWNPYAYLHILYIYSK